MNDTEDFSSMLSKRKYNNCFNIDVAISYKNLCIDLYGKPTHGYWIITKTDPETVRNAIQVATDKIDPEMINVIEIYLTIFEWGDSTIIKI